MSKVLFCSVILSILLWGTFSPATTALPSSPEACLQCHDDVVSTEKFAASVHGAIGCIGCHTDLVDIKAHTDEDLKPKPPQCVRCHKNETAEHYSSVHQLNGIDCSACHGDIHVHTPWQKDKRIASAKCAECHSEVVEIFNASIHGKSLAAGNMDSAACLDCHNLHAIKEIEEPGHPASRAFHTEVCFKCHSDREMMQRNGVTNTAVDTYMESYHGKNYRLGYPEKVAGCADCHTSHAVLPHDDPASSLHQDKLVATCGQCHSNSSTQFVKFHSHGDMTDKEKYPILYYTYVGMTSLLVSTFAVFWLHSLLWMFRGFVENRKRRRAMAAGLHPPLPDGHKIYRRFKPIHIFLHLLVILSFLLLALTGIPLKFAGQEWAKLLMGFLGGAENAGLLHRIGALVTFFYFFCALIMSCRFLFSGLSSTAEFWQRLFGPESLCPNMRDVRDITAMIRWFFFLGPKPSFERWTYWEKFDFFAVFWGMFAIGGSGLMLWFPEFFAAILPGWALNVATIVHSDEALLATGFIFTIHFFNTHGRPEKFPMDFVIFNGEINKEEFVEERSDQWKRYEKEGILDKYIKEKQSSVAYDFILKGIGFLALLTGVVLLLFMSYAFLAGGQHF